jgi:protein TonB
VEKRIDELTDDGRSGTCEVQFIVDREGLVSSVEALTMKGTKLAEVAVNAIKKGPKWVPAIQNGRQVKAWRRQKITFRLPDE